MSRLVPAPGEVVVVAAGLDLPPERVARLAATLSRPERARVGRAAGPDGRRRATASRGLLRELIGRATGRDPSGLDLRRSRDGRPYLAGHAVRFSVAHCGDRLLVALSPDRDVGVDLERHRTVPNADGVALRALPPEDGHRIAALAEPARSQALIVAWTRMEARFKATGRRGGDVTVRGLDVGPGWSAAVAAAGDDRWRPVRRASWEPVVTVAPTSAGA